MERPEGAIPLIELAKIKHTQETGSQGFYYVSHRTKHFHIGCKTAYFCFGNDDDYGFYFKNYWLAWAYHQKLIKDV